jgi:16S rRNA (cytosine967-C5)-methyltransferase
VNHLKKIKKLLVQPKTSEKVTKEKISKISAARQVAFEILLKVADEKTKNQSHSDDLLRTRAIDKLAPVDRNLATTLVLGVLRWQIALDAEIRKCLTRPNAKVDLAVMIALRMGAFQLLHLDRIPAHAAINESVEQVRESGHPFAVGMTNAVLRKIQAAKSEFVADAAAAHPQWMVERWLRFYGRDLAETICLHGQVQPQLAFRLRDESAESLLAGVQLAASEILMAARFVEAGEIGVAISEGEIRVQDEGSQLVGEIAAALIPSEREGLRVLDCCAAPGGKTLILAERCAGTRVLASDASKQRLEFMRKRFETLPEEMRERIECRVADATENFDAPFDLILADVPCSGTGTLGRNPEIRHRLTGDEIARQAVRQRAILKNALGALAVGGRLVYSTCSLEPEENEEVVGAVLNEMKNEGEIIIKRLNISEVIESLDKNSLLRTGAREKLLTAVTEQGALMLLPSLLGTDGFFVSAFERLN